MITENDPLQVKYRRMMYNMTISGIAVIGFGAWSLLRMVMYFVFHHVDFVGMVDRQLADELDALGFHSHGIVNVVVLLIFMSFLVLDLILRCYIGRSAITDAAAKKKKTVVYIIFAFVMGAILISGCVTQVGATYFSEKLSERVVYELTTSAVIDFTSGFAFLELAVSSVAARIYRKKLKDCGSMIFVD